MKFIGRAEDVANKIIDAFQTGNLPMHWRRFRVMFLNLENRCFSGNLPRSLCCEGFAIGGAFKTHSGNRSQVNNAYPPDRPQIDHWGSNDGGLRIAALRSKTALTLKIRRTMVEKLIDEGPGAQVEGPATIPVMIMVGEQGFVATQILRVKVQSGVSVQAKNR